VSEPVLGQYTTPGARERVIFIASFETWIYKSANGVSRRFPTGVSGFFSPVPSTTVYGIVYG